MSLRSGKTSSEAPPSPPTMAPSGRTSSASSNSSRPSPYLLLIYPIILAVGSLYSAISPVVTASHRASPLDPGIAASQNLPVVPHPANYFAGKRNLVNVYFVKIGWFWTTVAFALVQATIRPSQPARARQKSHYVQAFLRYGIATFVWILVTQWFFGPGLIDRSFTLTGGHCEAVPSDINTTVDQINKLPGLTSALACKAAGGSWRGGYDISGHVFILVLSSAFLLFELYLADRHSSHPSVSPRAAATIAQNTTEEEKKAVGGWENEQIAKLRIWSRYFVYGVVALDLWMLLMTAIWFHTWLEKLSGLFLAAGTVWTTYFLGDFVAAWKDVIGGV